MFEILATKWERALILLEDGSKWRVTLSIDHKDNA